MQHGAILKTFRGKAYKTGAYLLWETAACNGCVNVGTIQHLNWVLSLLDYLPELSLNGFQTSL